MKLNEFDARAREWDSNPMHMERSVAIARQIADIIPLDKNMKALEFGAGTGILSFLLADRLGEIVMMDNSREMVNVMNEKTLNANLPRLKPVYFDLEQNDFPQNDFNFVFTQMVLHHVKDTKQILKKFYALLQPNGYLAIADLYSEDGSFHGGDFNGHKGFDVTKLQHDIEKEGFRHLCTRNCYVIKKTIDGCDREFPVFLMVAMKPDNTNH